MKYYLLAGEPSGDLHGANLIKGLLKADPEAEFRFWGGDLMAAAGGRDNLRKHYRETSFFGIVQVLKNLGTIRRQMRECQADVAEFAPDVLILVDYPGFNMKMARWAKEHGIRTAIETTAFAKPLAFSRFIANADMIIIDLKHYSEKKYVQFTGVSNHSILENLDFAISIGKKVSVRITITPGINDTLIDARRYAHLLSEHHIRHVILLSYSNLGIIKYEKYTQSPTLAREQTFSGQDMENYANMLRGLGFDVQIEQ